MEEWLPSTTPVVQRHGFVTSWKLWSRGSNTTQTTRVSFVNPITFGVVFTVESGRTARFYGI